MLGGVARAGAPALLVPAGLLLALAVAATVGGGLRGLGQVVQGPEVPVARTPAQAGGGGAGGASRVPTIPAAPSTGAAPGGAGAAPVTPGAGGRSDTSSGGERRTPGGRTPADQPSGSTAPGGGGSPGGGSPGGGSPGGPSPAPSPLPTPPPAPAPPQDPIRQTGGAVAEAVRQVPLVGPPVADAVQQVLDTVDPPGRDLAGAASGVAGAVPAP